MRARGGALNTPAIQSVVAMIELYPDRWNPGAFETTNLAGERAHCFAAWTCRLAGLDLTAMLTDDPTGDAIYRTAMDLLGLDTWQAARLFLWVENDDGSAPTVDQLKERVTAATEVSFDWTEVKADVDGNAWVEVPG